MGPCPMLEYARTLMVYVTFGVKPVMVAIRLSFFTSCCVQKKMGSSGEVV